MGLRPAEWNRNFHLYSTEITYMHHIPMAADSVTTDGPGKPPMISPENRQQEGVCQWAK